MKSIESKYLKPEYNIIDIRDKMSFMQGHIYSAKNIDMNILVEIPERYLNKNDTYYIYCTSGSKSKRCVNMLNILGYNAINIEDGYEGYNKTLQN